MPWQLARSDRRRKAEKRPLVELTPHIDIHDLCRWKVFPDVGSMLPAKLEMSFKYPFLKSLLISRQNIEFNHVSGYNQRVALHWVQLRCIGFIRISATAVRSSSVLNAAVALAGYSFAMDT